MGRGYPLPPPLLPVSLRGASALPAATLRLDLIMFGHFVILIFKIDDISLDDYPLLRASPRRPFLLSYRARYDKCHLFS